MQIGHKMTELEAFEVLSVVLEHPVFFVSKGEKTMTKHVIALGLLIILQTLR